MKFFFFTLAGNFLISPPPFPPPIFLYPPPNQSLSRVFFSFFLSDIFVRPSAPKCSVLYFFSHLNLDLFFSLQVLVFLTFFPLLGFTPKPLFPYPGSFSPRWLFFFPRLRPLWIPPFSQHTWLRKISPPLVACCGFSPFHLRLPFV